MSKEEKNWYDIFIDLIYNKYPKKHILVQELMGLLIIEREAVYRRLRGDVIFTAHEVAKISMAWDISLDDIFRRAAFQKQKMDEINPMGES